MRRRLLALIAVLLLLAGPGCASTSTPAPPTAVPPTPAPVAKTTPVPSPTAAPTIRPAPTATLAPVPAPPLTRQLLKNAAYPIDLVAGGVAQLADGVYHKKYLPDSASEMVIVLTPFVVYGDVNGDGSEDAVTVLMADPGGSGTFYYLAPVLNLNGTARPVAAMLLGDRVYIRSLKVENRDIVIDMDSIGARDAACCPTDSRRLTYRLADDKLERAGVIDLPDPKVSARLDPQPRRVEFGPGVTSVRIEDTIGFNSMNGYLVAAEAGQEMTVTLTSPHHDVWLSMRGNRDRVVLTSILSETTGWAGVLSGTQDYLINAVAAGGDTGYVLQIEVRGAAGPACTPAPTATRTPAASSSKGVIHLTFDDGPTDPRWTPQVLEVLARYNARATFFILGQQAARYPDILTAELKAGHTLANHTYEHKTMDKIGREAFIQEVKSTEVVLGDRSTKCLRPPYGATDAYTRAYAAELGYTLVMWDIDTSDWSRPGVSAIASTVLNEAFPGAVVLFHDGGGDRAQTVEALGTVLEGLRKDGYTFEPVCR